MRQFRVERRAWLKLLATLAASPAAALQEAAPPQRVTREMLGQALKLAGLEFTDAQEAAILPRVNRALGQYEALRKIPIPSETEPAVHFTPWLPGKPPRSGPGRFLPTRRQAPKRRWWNSPEELAFLPVAELAPLVKARLVSSLDLTRMYIERLNRFAPKLNCLVTLTEKLALAQAGRADQEIGNGRYRGPLHGIPWGAKDLFATKGIRTTWGAEPYQNQVFDYDATVVERLERAGAVLVAKLSMGRLAAGGVWFGGETKNPWNLAEGSSGSSAGPAAAVAAGLVGFALGTETLGSIISPCVRCGVVGLRPTYGRVSRYGAMSLSWTMDKIGPIARAVEDCALVLRAICGPDGRDPAAVDAACDWDPRLPLDRLRVGLLEKEFASLKGEEKIVADRALEDLRKAGVKLEPVELNILPADALGIILSAEAAAAFDDLTRSGDIELLGGSWPNSFRGSRTIPAVEYIRAQRARTLLMRQMDEFLSRWDVLVGLRGPSLNITNLTGHPQVVVPCGFVKSSSRGLVFTGKLYEEGTPLGVALAFEQAAGWRKLHPIMDWA